eukprot:6187313-Pleurochrysis_carterae.AAC.1
MASRTEPREQKAHQGQHAKEALTDATCSRCCSGQGQRRRAQARETVVRMRNGAARAIRAHSNSLREKGAAG